MNKKLGISSNYKVRNMSLNDSVWIRELCEGVLKSHKLYMSEMFIDSYPCHIRIKCLLFVPRGIYTMKKGRMVVNSVLKLLKASISLRSNKNVSFKVGILPTVFGSSYVLSSYLKRRIEWNPFKFNISINKVLKKIGRSKNPYVSAGNKIKNRR